MLITINISYSNNSFKIQGDIDTFLMSMTSYEIVLLLKKKVKLILTQTIIDKINKV